MTHSQASRADPDGVIIRLGQLAIYLVHDPSHRPPIPAPASVIAYLKTASYDDLCSSVDMRASNSSYAARNLAPSPASVLKLRARSFKSRLISLTSSFTAFIPSLNPSITA